MSTAPRSGAESDIGLDISGDAETPVAEKPTLSHIGRYALKTLLGEGGLGCVYEAWDPLLSRTVAVKTLQFDLDMPSRIALDRLLLNEARAAANLNHAHIVTLHDAGLSAHGVYIAMERLQGRDLRQMLADGWQPTPDTATQIVRRVADALAYAHARGVVHCDIKPGNIFLTPKGKPKVLDFGIARAAHATATTQGDASIAGSPHYLAPEQLSSGVIDARSDIYSLGVVLYELLARRKAFPGDTLEQIHSAVRAGQPTPLLEVRPELPAALCDLVMRAMDPDPERRFATASDMSQALRHWASAAAVTGASADNDMPSSPQPKRRQAIWLLAASSAGVAVAAWWLMSVVQRPIEAQVAASTAASAAPGAAVQALATLASASAAASAAVPGPSEPAVAAAAASVPASDGRAPVGKAPARAAQAKTRTPPASAEPATVATGTLQIAVSPWGEIEVDGRPAGTTPPLTRLSLTEGPHTITIRNTDFPPFTATVNVHNDKPAVVRHRFGS